METNCERCGASENHINIVKDGNQYFCVICTEDMKKKSEKYTENDMECDFCHGTISDGDSYAVFDTGFVCESCSHCEQCGKALLVEELEDRICKQCWK